MVSKLLVSRAPPLRPLIFFLLSSALRAATFQRAPSSRGGGKAEENFARERQVSSDIQIRRERNRLPPPLPKTGKSHDFALVLLFTLPSGKLTGAGRPTVSRFYRLHRSSPLPIPPLSPSLTDVNPARDDMRVDLKINAPPD